MRLDFGVPQTAEAVNRILSFEGFFRQGEGELFHFGQGVDGLVDGKTPSERFFQANAVEVLLNFLF